MKKRFLVFTAIFFLATGLRIWHLAELAHFNYDEARDVVIERQILQGKLTLLGPESLLGQKEIYFGPLHYYLMAPALGFFNFDPLGPYFLTALLGGLTAVILAWGFGPWAGFLYTVFPMVVIYNRWAWNPNTIPLFAAIFLVCLRRQKSLSAGFFAGLAFQLHPTAVGLLLFSGRKIFSLLPGFIFGVLPMIIFDLRHDWFYFRRFQEIFSLGTGLFAWRLPTWHYFLWLIPALCTWLALFPRLVKIGLVVSFLAISSFWLVRQQPTTSQNPFYIQKLSKIIASDAKEVGGSFNVAAFTAADARATSFRYFLKLEGVEPLGVAQYPDADYLYVVTFEDKDRVIYNQTYEVVSFRPKRVTKVWRFGGVNIYRLEKS